MKPPSKPVRVLLVDDHQGWLQSVRSMLSTDERLHIVAEVVDGLEAVQKAQELLPDLVLLDIGLPQLNGIEAARRIGEHVPRAKILFVSANRSLEVVEEALRSGAAGYVAKSDVAKALVPAIEAVLRGEQFVSASLAGHDLPRLDLSIADHPHGKQVVPLPPRNVAIRHEIQLYSDDSAFMDGFAHLAEAALNAGTAVILIATESHRAAIVGRLRASGVDVDAAIEQGSYIPLDVFHTLSTFMVDNLPDPVRCARVVSDLVMRAAQGPKGEHRRVAICGECAPTLLAEGNAEAAIRLEHLWDENTRAYAADTLCGYLWNAFPHGNTSPALQRICAEHSAVQGRALGY